MLVSCPHYTITFDHLHAPSPVFPPVFDDDYWIKKSEEEIAANFKSRESLEKEVEKLTQKMKEKAGNLDFKGAAMLRDRIKELKNLMLEMY
jgi:excinuclease UvrABC helicase subunit UvrB